MRFALVNQTLARLLETRGPVLGQTVQLSPASVCEVIGVMADIQDESPDGKVLPTMYPYFSDRSSYGLVMLVRLRHPSSAARVQLLLQEVWGEARRTREVVFMNDVVDQALAEDRGRWQLLATMTVLCILVTFAGVASAVSHSIQHTSKQMAIRLVLGATPGRLLRGLASRTLCVAALGMALGLAAGQTVIRGSTKLFPGIVAQDIGVMSAATVLVTLVVGGAALWAGRSVRKVNPSALLRAGL
jgi:predicted lysophospholipase L1 biosynthesis ABC-type transport system permease subunit